MWKLPATVPQQLVLQKAGYLARKIINTVYKGYVGLLCRHLVVARSLVMPYIKHLCVVLPLIMLYLRYAHLRPTYIGLSEE